jgi:hypothetical protein
MNGFSQEEPFQKVSQFDFQLKWNQARVRLDQTIANSKNPFRFEGTVRLNRVNISVGMLFPLEEGTFFTATIGQEYRYKTNQWNSLLGASFRSKFKYGLIRINYGSNWIDNHGVSTTLMYNLIGPFVRVGIATNDELIGWRTEWQLSFGKNSKKKFRVHIAHFPKENRWDWGVRFRFQNIFPKIQKKFDKLGGNFISSFKKSK